MPDSPLDPSATIKDGWFPKSPGNAPFPGAVPVTKGVHSVVWPPAECKLFVGETLVAKSEPSALGSIIPHIILVFSPTFRLKSFRSFRRPLNHWLK